MYFKTTDRIDGGYHHPYDWCVHLSINYLFPWRHQYCSSMTIPKIQVRHTYLQNYAQSPSTSIAWMNEWMPCYAMPCCRMRNQQSQSMIDTGQHRNTINWINPFDSQQEWQSLQRLTIMESTLSKIFQRLTRKVEWLNECMHREGRQSKATHNWKQATLFHLNSIDIYYHPNT